MLNDCFNAIRRYIRYGDSSTHLNFCFALDPSLTYENETNSHIVGARWNGENMFGFISWFNKFTCYFLVSLEKPKGINLKLPVSVFNNTTKSINDL